ncbi:MAG: hypothetical protein IJ381_01540 [Clostridia bacterium]|nr:hypothetical protein [Clostridia bacterium]
MKESFELIVLTCSAKYGGYCVAGIETQSGQFCRLISTDESRHGALNANHLCVNARNRIELLDRILVRNAEHLPGPIQNENYLVESRMPLQFIAKESIDTAMRIHPPENRESVFLGNSHLMRDGVDSIGHSLELLYVTQLRIYSLISWGKTKTKADFVYNGKRYQGFSVTDQRYFDQKGSGIMIDEACVVFSIADDEWARENGYYKYLAAIYEL